MINIALLGFGVIGNGTAEVLTENKALIEERLGCNYHIKAILDLHDFPDSPFGHLITHDFNTILNDPEISVVVEMMGGARPAYDFTKAALEAGKNVVTSNKEVVSTFGVELGRIAWEHGVRYLFEASVGGGIPIIRPMINDLSSNRINSVNGILNGTTNYILTAMRDQGADFSDALKEAQRLGYAEANPSADVDGIDAARKISILAALATGKLIDPKTVHTEGITRVTSDDIRVASALGGGIKLIGHMSIQNGKMTVMVSPRMVFSTNPLSRIDDVFNGILINANMLGDVMFYGPGAGKLPTASAVVADIIDVIANRNAEPPRMNWTPATQEDVACFSDYACGRILILKNGTSVPAEWTPFETREIGTYTVLRFEKLTEREADALVEILGDRLLSIYRTL